MRSTTTKRSVKRRVRSTAASRPVEPRRVAPQWRINGYPADILIWTVEEWDRLPIRPTDARYHPSGVWCALRIP